MIGTQWSVSARTIWIESKVPISTSQSLGPLVAKASHLLLQAGRVRYERPRGSWVDNSVSAKRVYRTLRRNEPVTGFGRQQPVGGPIRHVRNESASGPRGHRAQPDAGRTPPPDLSHDPRTWTGSTTTREPLKPRAGILRIERAAGGTDPAPMHPDAAGRAGVPCKATSTARCALHFP